MTFVRCAVMNKMEDVPCAGPGVPIDEAYAGALRSDGMIREGENLAVLEDRLVFIQSERGYRFGIDAVVLARFAAGAEPEAATVLDIGAGCGVVGILLADALPAARVTAIEIQPVMADRASRNIALNRLSGRMAVVNRDVVDFAREPDVRFDLIVSNPPFYRSGSGRINPDGERAIARHEIRLDMSALMSAVSALLSPSGVAVVLYPAERLDDCVTTASEHGLAPAGLVPLVPNRSAPPESFLIELVPAVRRPSRVETLAPILLCRT